MAKITVVKSPTGRGHIKHPDKSRQTVCGELIDDNWNPNFGTTDHEGFRSCKKCKRKFNEVKS